MPDSNHDNPSARVPEIPQIPEHRLIRVIGTGSYGEVWLARSVVGTFRAVKIVRRSQFKTPKPFDREFSGIQRFEPISRRHPGLVAILQIGCDEERGYFYYVMELADDAGGHAVTDPDKYEPKTLASVLDEKLSINQCIQIGISLAEAVSFLHGSGLVHRDIKPSNILLVGNTPKLADIGMVARLDEKMSFVGTEGFIPPEGPGTVQADIYSLGKVLYEIAARRDRLEFPALPVETGFVDWDQFLELNEVLLRACNNDRAKRYASADDLLADLQALRAGKSVQRLRRLENQIARAKRVTLVGGLGLVAALVLALPIYRDYRLRHDEYERRIGADVANGLSAIAGGDYIRAVPHLINALDVRDPLRQKTHRLRLNSVLDQIPAVTWLKTEKGQTFFLEFSPEGDRLATSSRDTDTRVFFLNDDRPPLTLQHKWVRQIAVGPEKAGYATVGWDGHLKLWSALGELRKDVVCTNQLSTVAFSFDGRFIATGGIAGDVRLWAPEDGRQIAVGWHRDRVEIVMFSRNGKLLASGGIDNDCAIWPVDPTFQRIKTLVHQSWVTGLSFHPFSNLLATASLDHKAHIWNVDAGIETIPAIGHADGVRSVDFSPDGRFFASACYDSSVRLWNASNGELVAPIFPLSGRALGARFSPDGRFLATSCWDGSVRLFDRSSVTEFDSFDQSNAYFPKIPASEFESHVVQYTSEGATNTVWEAGRLILKMDDAAPRQIPCQLSNARGAALRAAGIVACWSGRKLEAFSISGKGPALWKGEYKAPINYVGFSLDGKLLVICESDSSMTELSAHIVRTSDGSEVCPPLQHHDGVLYATFNRDGTRLLTCSEDRTASIWDTATGKITTGPMKHNHQVYFGAFSDSGNWVATACKDGTVQVWDALTGDPTTPPLRHNQIVARVGFLDGDTRLATQIINSAAFAWRIDSSPRPLGEIQQRIDLIQNDIVAHSQTNRPLKMPIADPCTVALWHKRQAQSCAETMNFAGEQFHLKYANAATNSLQAVNTKR